MEFKLSSALISFNQLHQKISLIYHNYAKASGLSDMAFWILYCLYEHGGTNSQRSLCEECSAPPQTVNSSLKALEEKGLISLELTPGSRKNKIASFTPEGEQLAQKIILPLVQAEERSFIRLGHDELVRLLQITERHANLLDEEINKLIK